MFIQELGRASKGNGRVCYCSLQESFVGRMSPSWNSMILIYPCLVIDMKPFLNKRAASRNELIDRFTSLFSRSLCQHLLHCLLFLQKEGSHDATLEADSTARTPIGTRHGAFSLLRGVVFAGFEVLDSLQRHFAITALWSIGSLDGTLLLEDASGSSDSTRLVRDSIVGMASHPCPAIIRHDFKLKVSDKMQKKGEEKR
jgi:hypothetical protein